MAELALKEQTQEGTSIWKLFDEMISKGQLALIPSMTAVNSEDSFKQALRTVRTDRIVKIVYDKKEENLLKFNSLFSALSSADSSIFVILNNSGNKMELYLGINSHDSNATATAMATMEGALQGNFPGIIAEDVDQDTLLELSEEIRQGKCVSCVTGIPSRKNDNDIPFAQGLEKIIYAMGDKPYVALFLATPISNEKISQVERAYQNLYSQLSLMNLNQLSLTQQQSMALAKSIGHSYSTALSTNISQTNTTSHTDTKTQTQSKSLSNTKSKTSSESLTDTNTTGYSSSHTDGTNSSHTDTTSTGRTKSYGTIGKVVGGTLGMFWGPVGAIAGSMLGGGIGDLAGSSTTTTSHSDTTGSSHSDTTTNSSSTSKAYTRGESASDANTATNSNSMATGMSDGTSTAIQHGRSKTKTTQDSSQDTSTLTDLQGISFNYAVVEKYLVESLKILDEQLVRLRQAKNYGGWNWSAYFIGDTNNVTSVGANVLSGILRGEQSGVEHSAIMQWDGRDANLPAIRNELAKFRHPLFMNAQGELYSPTSMLSTPELAVGMSLPQKSLPGIPVFTSAEFGRSVVSISNSTDGKRVYHFGHIIHLDKEYNNLPVDLDLDSLTSHAFITGSTGSGKSNAIYGILAKLREERIPFLVIEPAKGEYKDIFGGLRSVTVYGTNPYQTELLHLNPFSFPKGIHIIEHIDRLIGILNAAWPMYSAMPAILKKAIEKTYEKYGWNLLTSRNDYSPEVFPDFTDLMDVLPGIIEETDYSAEVTGNYKGALLERVGSLTNGYYRSLLQKEELPQEALFDRPVIVDLSRVSSMETKALLMGIIFMKLQEHRIANASAANSSLKHITVLEEAHHLLRKTSSVQTDEGTNLTGKSIEMLTNAIAEMRTYGEGFIIADQAPDLLDPAVIRNTNTKIVFNLPDYSDRLLVGKGQGLSDSKIEELSHLRTGYASVFQSNWQESVLCKVNKFDPASMTNMGNAP